MGPLIGRDSVDKYLRFQEIAKREGAAAVARSLDSLQRKVRLGSGEEVDLTATLRRIAPEVEVVFASVADSPPAV